VTIEKKNRTIKSILDLKTGREILSDVFFQMGEDKIFQVRYEFETAIREKVPHFVCYYCKQPIKIRGQVDSKKIMHFAHLRDSEECPIKTGNKFTKEEILRIKYNGAKESDLHFELKNLIANCLEKNKEAKEGIENVEIEKVYKHKAIPKIWKKPDISSVYNSKNIVFELQLSTTFLSVINSRQEFYKQNRTFILWIFSSFETDDEKRKFTQSDIFFNNNFNGFEFNKEAIELSAKGDDLVLKCHYQKPFIERDYINTRWESEFVKLNQLLFDERNYKVYYFDYQSSKSQLEEELSISQSLLISEIINGDWYKISNLIIDNYTISELERKKIIELYDNKIKPIDIIDRYDWRINIIWATVILKLRETTLIERITKDYHLKSIVFDILSLKLNKKIGYAFTKQIQIAHSVFQSRPEYIDLYLRAVKLYRPNLFTEEDNSGKLRKRINVADDKKPVQNNDNYDVLKIMFPELMKK
jgi:competence CoiA-like predicted nuclease